jgi:hypothetical protein
MRLYTSKALLKNSKGVKMKKYLFSICAAALLIASLVANAIAQPEVIIKHKVNPNSQSPNHVEYQPTQGSTTATSALLYHGGPLINTPTIYIIWYGNWNQSNGSDTPAGQQLIRDWANGIGGSPYFQINVNNSVSGYPISGNANYGGDYTDPSTKTRLSDSDIKTSVDNAISGNHLPYDPNGVYFVITSSEIRKTGFCTQYCGWHTAGNVSVGHVRYSFIGNANRCLSACAAQTLSPNGNAGVDGAISVLSHELEEATTDPDLNAWYDSSGAENADKCAWTFGHNQFQTPNGAWANMTFGGHSWLIQRNLYKSGSSWFCMVNSSQN